MNDVDLPSRDGAIKLSNILNIEELVVMYRHHRASKFYCFFFLNTPNSTAKIITTIKKPLNDITPLWDYSMFCVMEDDKYSFLDFMASYTQRKHLLIDRFRL